jgi:hypothetical protein
MGSEHRAKRVALLSWAVQTLTTLPRSNPRERIRQMAALLPANLPLDESSEAAG